MSRYIFNSVEDITATSAQLYINTDRTQFLQAHVQFYGTFDSIVGIM